MPNNPNAAKNLKPFVKGDKRINRDGRPQNARDLGALFRRIGHEIATTKDKGGNVVPVLDPDGRPMTVIEVIARQKAQDKRYQEEFLNRAYGKIPTPVTLQGDDEGGPVRIVTEVIIGGTQAPGKQATGTVLDEPST